MLSQIVEFPFSRHSGTFKIKSCSILPSLSPRYTLFSLLGGKFTRCVINQRRRKRDLAFPFATTSYIRLARPSLLRKKKVPLFPAEISLSLEGCAQLPPNYLQAIDIGSQHRYFADHLHRLQERENAGIIRPFLPSSAHAGALKFQRTLYIQRKGSRAEIEMSYLENEEK